MKFKIKKSYYRLFSVLLSLVMIVLSVPIAAFADGGDGTVPTIPPITEGETVTPEPIDPPPDDDGGADAGTDGVVVPPIPDEPDPNPTYLEDGVYTIRNIGNSGMYMDTNADSPFANSYMQQTRYTSSPVTSTSIGAFFKITRRSNNLYVIRLMTNNCLTFASSNGDVKTVEISPNDSSVASSQLFAITAYENGYRIKSNADNKLIVAPSGSASGDSNAAARLDSVSSVADGRDKWIFTKYTGSSFTNVTINECPTKMITGQTANVNAYVSSTLVGRNGPIEYSVTETNYLDTNKATINETSGVLTANSIGTVYVWATCSGTSYETHKTVSIEENLEGTYFFNNVEYDDKFMQIDNNASPSENGAFMELWDFDGEDYQKWSLVHVGDWYYKIVSVASGKALTVPSSADENVTQATYTGAANQHWLFSKNSDGSYTVRSQNYYLAAGDGTFTSDGRNVEGRTAQSDGKDEWQLHLCNQYAHVTLISRIMYDSNIGQSSESYQQIFNDATAGILSKYNIRFYNYSTTSTSLLNLDPDCSNPYVYDPCSDLCGPLNMCSTTHHKSGDRILDTFASDFYYTCSFVEYNICHYDTEEDEHNPCNGLGNVSGQNCVVSYFGSRNRVVVLQHELSHNLGVSGHDCTPNQQCVMNSNNPTLDHWCDNHSAMIRDNIYN
ncbi:MAG: RICIN domain-containing protein [Clostridia bacterium]|nr:RICIN domain-containing protein [Clostridia bacterium]